MLVVKNFHRIAHSTIELFLTKIISLLYEMIWNLVQTIPLSIYKTATLDQTNKTIIVLSHEQSSFHAIFRHDTAPFSK